MRALLAAATMAASVASHAPAAASDREGVDPPPAAAAAWRALTRGDLAAAHAFIGRDAIGAVYPDPEAFRRREAAAFENALGQADGVVGFGGYSAVLRRFANALDDEHAGVVFAVVPNRIYWPGFVIRFVAGRYVAAASTVRGVADGEVVSSCDGAPIDAVARRVAVYEGGHPGLDTTNAAAALAILIDRGNPYLARSSSCVVGGRTVELEWRRIPLPDYVRGVLPLSGREDRTVAIRDEGGGVAWVRLGNFQPVDKAEADAFHRVIDAAPVLRDRRVIVIDVRQNGGGPYDWAIAFLKALYGDAYVDFYARARLAISPVYRVTPDLLSLLRQSDAVGSSLGEPVDVPTHFDPVPGVTASLALGRALFRPRLVPPPRAAAAPPSLVLGDVLVLTDGGCASVCIGFVDELKRFPGVRQIGGDTLVDDRTGTPVVRALPSGLSYFYVPTMTRDGRERGDNVPQRPDLRFVGDPSDDAAVLAWVRTLTGPRGAGAGSPSSRSSPSDGPAVGAGAGVSSVADTTAEGDNGK